MTCHDQREGGITQVTLIGQDLMTYWGKLEIEGLAICTWPQGNRAYRIEKQDALFGADIN